MSPRRSGFALSAVRPPRAVREAAPQGEGLLGLVLLLPKRANCMVARKKKGGRPLKHSGEGVEFEMLRLGRAPLSKTLSFRVRPRLAELLQDAAAKASRTVSQEIEHRLERSFHDDRVAQAHFGSDVGAELLRMFYSAMVFEGVHPDWSGDPVRAENFRTAMNAIIAVFTGLPLELPPPHKRNEGLQTAKQFLLRSTKEKALSDYMEIMFSELEDLDWGEAPVVEEKPRRVRSR